MGKLKICLLICICTWFCRPLPCHAQNKDPDRDKTIVDSRTKLPLDYVAISSDDNKIKLMSNKDGKFIMINDVKVTRFSFYKMGYRSQTISSTVLLNMDTIFLVEKPFELEEIVVESKKTEVIVKDKRFYVDDYRALPNAGFLLINSKINVSGVEVCYYDKTKGISQVKKIRSEEGAHFVTDCFKNIHLVTNDFSRQVFFDSDSSFDFLPKYPRKLFDSTLGPCVLKIDTQLILKHVLPPVKINFEYTYIKQNSPFFNYYRVSKHSRELFYAVGYNDRMLEMINHEIADIRATQRNEFTGDNKIDFFFSRIAGPLYAPVFLKNDTVVLFNFQENRIVFLNKIGLILKAVPLDEQQFSTIRNFEILYDASAQKFYMKMNEADRPVIKLVNIYSGSAVRNVKLENIFAKNIQIVNDRIYYLVREKEWDGTQYLYQQN